MAAEPLKPGSVPPKPKPRKRSPAELGFAYGTKVEVPVSRAEAESLLSRNGAKRILSGWDSETGDGYLLFQLGARYYRLDAPKRPLNNRDLDQVNRERWRTLVLLLKGQLEMVRAEMVSFERLFLPFALLADGRTTVGDQIEPALDEMYETGKMGNLLPDFGAPRLGTGGNDAG